MNHADLLTAEFRALSARLGSDPLQVQGPGGNTSVKDDSVMWIKASGTWLAEAETRDIFVPVDLDSARPVTVKDDKGQAGTRVLSGDSGLRPSIETSFHAALDHAFVVHTHSVATLVHAISHEGLQSIAGKLAGLPYAIVPYAKPGIALTEAMLARVDSKTRVVILENHGLVCCGDSVDEVSDLVEEVELKLRIHVSEIPGSVPDKTPHSGYAWSEHSWLAQDRHFASLALSGSYYPDHVVFLGPALPLDTVAGHPPVKLARGVGILVRKDATPSQLAMFKCLVDIFQRLPRNWTLKPIGTRAEAELLNWDAEKYRQALAENRF